MVMRRGTRVLVCLCLLGGCSGGAPGSSSPGGDPADAEAARFGVNTLGPPLIGDNQDRFTSNWGQRMRAAPDVDEDGTAEVVVGDPAHAVNGMFEGRVVVVSGKDRSVLYEVSAPVPSEALGFGTYLSVFPGPTGPAVAVGASTETVDGRPGQGRTYVFSLNETEVSLLYVLNDPVGEEGARFGERIGRAGDVVSHGNGISDLIVASPGRDAPPGCSKVPNADRATCRANVGQVHVFDGVTGDLVRSLDMPSGDVGVSPGCNDRNSCGGFGNAVQGPGDIDGDGRGDQLVSASDYDFPAESGPACGEPEPNGCNEAQGRQYLFSGADGTLLATIDDPEPQADARFGFQDVAADSPGDVNADGVPDLYAHGFQQAGPLGPDEGGAWVFDGRKTIEQGSGVVLYKVTDPNPSIGGQFGWSMTRTDFEPDGKPDLFVGSAPHHLLPTAGDPFPDQRGGTGVIKGSDGSVLEVLDLPQDKVEVGSAGNLGSNLGWSLAAPGDLNADGRPDYVAGAPFTDAQGVQDQGEIIFFLSE